MSTKDRLPVLNAVAPCRENKLKFKAHKHAQDESRDMTMPIVGNWNSGVNDVNLNMLGSLRDCKESL